MRHAIILWVVMLVAACASTPDTALSPDPPPSYAPLAHPFKDAKLFHDQETAAARWAQANGRPAWLEPRVPRRRMAEGVPARHPVDGGKVWVDAVAGFSGSKMDSAFVQVSASQAPHVTVQIPESSTTGHRRAQRPP